jgi:hypothetical protein
MKIGNKCFGKVEQFSHVGRALKIKIPLKKKLRVD